MNFRKQSFYIIIVRLKHIASEEILMTKMIAYERNGKFGKEYLIPLSMFKVIPSKETEKAIACGEFEGTYKNGDPKYSILGWIPKSTIVDVCGERLIPSWVVDKWKWSHLQITQQITRDFLSSNRSWEIRQFSF